MLLSVLQRLVRPVLSSQTWTIWSVWYCLVRVVLSGQAGTGRYYLVSGQAGKGRYYLVRPVLSGQFWRFHVLLEDYSWLNSNIFSSSKTTLAFLPLMWRHLVSNWIVHTWLNISIITLLFQFFNNTLTVLLLCFYFYLCYFQRLNILVLYLNFEWTRKQFFHFYGPIWIRKFFWIWQL